MSRFSAFPAAPHRMLFVVGMFVATAGGLWWAASLLGRLLPAAMLPMQVVPMWVHAWLMVFGLLGPFLFGFLFTTFPRWQSAPEVPRRLYVPVFGGVFLAPCLGLAGALGSAPAFLVAVMVASATWLAAWVVLLRVMLIAEKIVSHAVVAAAAVGVAALAQVGYAAGLWLNDAAILHASVLTALWGGVLPLVYAVCHRMVPFFTQAAVPGYRAVRPTWWLVAVSLLFAARLGLMVSGSLAWLWLTDLPLASLTLYTAWRWRPLSARGIPLLWSLYTAYLWLPVGLALQSAADLSFAATGDWLVGRAPLHALGIGFLASLVLAMATRVTLGHSGRRLVMDRFTLACFLALQAAAVLRVGSELTPIGALVLPLLLASALAWLAGMLPWAARYGKMLLLPRVDGRPG